MTLTDDCTSVGSYPLIAALPRLTRDGLPWPVCNTDGVIANAVPVRVHANVRLWRAAQFDALGRLYRQESRKQLRVPGAAPWAASMAEWAERNAEAHRTRGRELMAEALGLSR